MESILVYLHADNSNGVTGFSSERGLIECVGNPVYVSPLEFYDSLPKLNDGEQLFTYIVGGTKDVITYYLIDDEYGISH
ncbi:hypothetical protein [Zobellella aerophila]|uniref:Uncharacterized protein n=1 Tax=Zobellella aerophila TaxID=870480 RepID=A0ABP6WIC1_9GAMM